MLHRVFVATLLAALSTSTASAQVTFELIGQPWEFLAGADISADGEVIVGNQVGPYETFRWTAETGPVLLGRGTVAALGVGAGAPNVSNDGTRISATILSEDGLRAIAGVWHDGVWNECIPQPPDAATVDQSDSSAWGLSGDGLTLVGLYWRVPAGGGNAYPLAWTAAGGGVRLGPGGVGIRSGRANAANFDGTVAAGWREAPQGYWQPTVWENGVETLLEATGVGCPLYGINHDGTIALGQDYNAGFQRREAAFWTKTDATWVKTQLGVLPGTSTGQAYAKECSADGSIIVGTNRYFNNPGGPSDGFIWTQATGMVKVSEFLANNGVTVDPFFAMTEMTAVTPDGRVLLGIGRWTDTLDLQTFRITLAPPSVCPGDSDGSNFVDFDDITVTLANWGALTAPYTEGDANGDCVVNFDDITESLANWGVSCP